MSKEDISNEGTIPCILYGELYTTYLNKIENIVSRIKRRTNIILAKKGDVILPLSGETPLDISNSAVIPFDGVALGGDLIAFRTSLNPLFLSYQLSSKRKLQIARLAQGKSVVHSNPNQLIRLWIFYPSKKEQDKIAQTLFCVSKKIELIGSKVEVLKKYKEGIMKLCLSLSQNEGKTLKHLVSENELKVGRGTIIPRQEGIYPVYSSSAKNDGLFCYTNFYKYDEDLITWSIDGGGQPFYRKKHKFSITNVCGFIKIIDFVKWDYTWLYINIWNNWRHNKFDYISKAHPSIIEEIYKIKPLSLDNQKKISSVFLVIEKHEKNLESKLNKLKEIKKYLLSNLFI